MEVMRPLLSLLALGLFAQETIRVDVDIVNVLCTVRTKNGGLVGNLEKDAFTLFENGEQQNLKYFSRETNLPLTLGLLVDVSRSMESLLEIEKQAAYHFLDSVLTEKDQAFLIAFGSEAELLQDYTNSRKLLRKGLDGLRINSAVGGLHPGPVPTMNKVRGTILWDAIYLGAADQLKGQVGRKALIVITDGADHGSRYRLDQAIKAAQMADAIVYGIIYSDPRYGWGGDGDMKRIATETGGRSIRVDRGHKLPEVFKEIQEELRSQYSLGYTPKNAAKDGSFRKIEIKMKDREMKVQARKGYFAVPQSE